MARRAASTRGTRSRWAAVGAVMALALGVGAAGAAGATGGPASAAPAALSDVIERAQVFFGGTGVRIVGQISSPDNAWIVYRVERTFTHHTDLYAVPTLGGIPVRLSWAAGHPVGDVSDEVISDDSTTVVFWAQPEGSPGMHLFSTPITGGTLTRLAPPSDSAATTSVINGLISPDSTRVVYTAAGFGSDHQGVFSVPIGGGTAVRLSPDGVPAGNDVRPMITSDSSRVVFGARHAGGGTDLWSAPIGGGAPTRLNTYVPDVGGVVDAEITPDGAHVAFLDSATGTMRAYAVPTAGGTVVLLSSPAPGDLVNFLHVTPDSARVVFGRSSPLGVSSTLYSAPVTGGSLATLIDPNAPVGLISCPGGVEISPDSSRVVFEAYVEGGGTLYGVPTAGGSPTALSSAPVSADCGRNLLVTPDSSRVLFLAWVAGLPDRLLAAPLAGGPVVRVDQLDVTGRVWWPVKVTPDSAHVLYTADFRQTDQRELFLSPVSGGSWESRSNPLPDGGSVDTDIVLTPDGDTAVYVADQLAVGIQQLFVRSAVLSSPGPVALAVPAAATSFVAQFPTRVFDSRPGEETPFGSGALKGLIDADETIEVPIAGYAGVPPEAAAVALNVTATDAVAPGFVTVWPTGLPRPLASSINVTAAGQTRPNLVIVPLGLDGRVSMYSQSGTHLVADVVGSFLPVSGPVAGGRLIGLGPTRVFDTRPEEAAVPGPKGLVPAGSAISVQVAGVAGVPPNATAVVMNLTATDAVAAGFVTAWPAGELAPLASSLNLPGRGATASNLVMVPLGAGGRVQLYSQSGTHLLGDVTAYVTSPLATVDTLGLFVPVLPVRGFDSRSETPPTGPLGFVGADTTITVRMAEVLGLPSSPPLVTLNLTATEAATGFVTVYPGPSLPLSSSLNLQGPDDTRANAVMTPAVPGVVLNAYAHAGAHLVMDVTGYTIT